MKKAVPRNDPGRVVQRSRFMIIPNGTSPPERRNGKTPALNALSASGRESMNSCILAIAERGDKQAFAQLFGYYAPRLKSFLIRQNFDPTVAEDIVQDAMTAVWNKAGTFDPERAQASTWIFTIARNLGTDRKRRDGRLVQMAEPQDHEQPDSAPLADETVSAQQDETRLRSVLGQLPHDQATVIKLFFFSDNPHSEIARTLGIPLGTVKSRLRLALQRLRQLMDIEL